MIFLLTIILIPLCGFFWSMMIFGGAVCNSPPNGNERTKLILNTVYIDIISVFILTLFMYDALDSFGYKLYLLLMTSKLTFLHIFYGEDIEDVELDDL